MTARISIIILRISRIITISRRLMVRINNRFADRISRTVVRMSRIMAGISRIMVKQQSSMKLRGNEWFSFQFIGGATGGGKHIISLRPHIHFPADTQTVHIYQPPTHPTITNVFLYTSFHLII